MNLSGQFRENLTGNGLQKPSSATRENLIPAAITDTGCERDLNEDRYAVIESLSGLAWVVCDGMGGMTGGELAAQLAIEAIRRDLENGGAHTPEGALKSALLEANRIIVLRRQNPAFQGMGTTIVSALFYGPEVVIANVGDSRSYLVRDGAIQQLTTDHTFVQSLVDQGKITQEEALAHPQAHVLTRCLGSEPGLQIDSKRYWIWENEPEAQTDFIVLCTDGLYSHLSDGEIASIVSDNTPQKACVALVELAKSRGGFDNITVAVLPLGGQLRQEPPNGCSTQTLEAVVRKEQGEKLTTKQWFKERIGWVVGLWIFLSVVVVTLIVIFMMMSISK